MRNSNYMTGGIGLGSIIAVVLMWSVHHSILWAILGAFLSWIYVAFYVGRYYFNLY